MEDPQVNPTPPAEGRTVGEPGALRALANAIKSRIFSGLVLALPIAITIWIIYWLYVTLQGMILAPLARLINWYTIGDQAADKLPFWWDRVLAPFFGIATVLAFLYFLGYFVHTRLARAVDWMMLRVPLVTTIYKSIRNVSLSLQEQGQGQRSKRAVLVEFPHPGMRALAFVTKSLQDPDTRKTILGVCVLTGVMPPTGFTLFVPEEDVIELDWSVNQTLQAILSGGITTPASVPFSHGARTQVSAGPIVDTQGHPIDVCGTKEDA